MTVALLVLWLGAAAYLLGRGLAYLTALIARPGWGWVTDVRMALLLAPFVLPVALYFYRSDPAARVIVLLAFVMLLGWCTLYVFRTLYSEAQDSSARVNRMSHWVGLGLGLGLVLVVLASIR